MEVFKTIFLCKWLIFRFHVNFHGCKLYGYGYVWYPKLFFVKKRNLVLYSLWEKKHLNTNTSTLESYMTRMSEAIQNPPAIPGEDRCLDSKPSQEMFGGSNTDPHKVFGG